jgi:sugar-specific transcriptional regulator TrmB
LVTENIRNILEDFGLTEKEIEIYIFISKHGSQRSGEIAKGVKTHRTEVYRMLKSLQSKGLVYSTLETHSRFTAAPFETVVDSFIRSKRAELATIESSKQNLLKDWNVISRQEPPLQQAKFLVMEGNQRIWAKILEMASKTKRQFQATLTIQGIAQADQFGILKLRQALL